MGSTDQPRLAYVSQWFAPEPDGPATWIASAMRDEGFNVGVITGVPHYPSGVPAPGYRAYHRGIEEIDGHRILRLPEYPSHDRSAMRRITTFGSFALSASIHTSRAIGAADLCLVYSSPATAALPAVVANRRFGTPYVLLVEDLC